jgi:hypothetical protein
VSSQPTPIRVFTVSTSTAQFPVQVYPPAGTQLVEVPKIESAPDTRAAKIADAIYGHVQAVRALGRNEISVSEVARALGLSDADVMQALPLLRTKGVKAP